MTVEARFLFDENFGKPMVATLRQLAGVCREPVEVAHILDFYDQGKADDIWIPRLQEDWIIISADRARKRGGVKLPQLCREFGRTHVLLSKSLHELKQFQKARAVLHVWPRLVELAKQPGGTRAALRLSSGATTLIIQAATPG